MEIRVALDFLLGTVDTEKANLDNFEESYFEPKMLYPAKLRFKREKHMDMYRHTRIHRFISLNTFERIGYI